MTFLNSGIEESLILLLRESAVFCLKVYTYFHLVSSLYVRAMLTCEPNDAIVLGKCWSVTPSIFVCFRPFQVFFIIPYSAKC